MSDFIKSEDHIGRTIYHNIDTGISREVRWGSVDWLLAVFVFGVLGALLAALVGIARAMWLAI